MYYYHRTLLSSVLFIIYTAELARIKPVVPEQTLSFTNDVILYWTGSNSRVMVTDIQETEEDI